MSTLALGNPADFSLPLSFFFFNFICYEGESTSREKQRQGERERIPSRLHAASTEPDVGFELLNREIVT